MILFVNITITIFLNHQYCIDTITEKDKIEAEIVARAHEFQREHELHDQQDRHRRGAPGVAHGERERGYERAETGDNRERGERLRKIDRERHQAEEVREPCRDHEVGKQRQRKIDATKARAHLQDDGEGILEGVVAQQHHHADDAVNEERDYLREYLLIGQLFIWL